LPAAQLGSAMARLEQFQLKSDRKAILKLKKLLAFLVWSTSATTDDALALIFGIRCQLPLQLYYARF
jgi:hypothetical protein